MSLAASRLFSSSGVASISRFRARLSVPRRSPPCPARTSHIVPAAVPGLRLVNDYLSPGEHDEVVSEIENVINRSEAKFSSEFGRRIANLHGEQQLASRIPKTFAILKRVLRDGHIAAVPNSIQVNEYRPEGGCPMHTDAKSVGDVIGMFSLLSPCVMDLHRLEPGAADSQQPAVKDKAQVLLEPRSLLVLRDEVRAQWEHGVQPAAQHTFGGRPVPKSRRLSLVFWRTLSANAGGGGIAERRPEVEAAVRQRITLASDIRFPKPTFEI